jgi:hypothetical protein
MGLIHMILKNAAVVSQAVLTYMAIYKQEPDKIQGESSCQ